MTLAVRRGPTPLPGMDRLWAERAEDARGGFARLFDAEELGFRPAQISRSDSVAAGTLRGLHFQAAPHQETKVVHVLSGRVWDVALDLRPGPGRGRWHGVELGPGEGIRLEAGLAHGFLTLEPNTSLLYLMDVPFEPTAVAGFRWDSAEIRWPAEPTILSERDRALPPFEP